MIMINNVKCNISKKIIFLIFLLSIYSFAFAELDLQISTSNDMCATGTNSMSGEIRLYNSGSTTENFSQYQIRLWFNVTNGKTVTIDVYSQSIEPWAASGTSLSTNRTVTSFPQCNDAGNRNANTLLIIDITSTTPVNVEPGRYARITFAIHYTDWAAPFDTTCDDYSRLQNFPLGDTKYVAVYRDDGTLVQEYKSVGNPDPNTGVPPCSIPTATPTNTPPFILNIARETHGATSIATVNVLLSLTDTPTITYTPTRTYTPTNTNTHTQTNTFTDTFTPTYTNTATNTRTNTPTNTVTNTPTDTPTRTFTPTNTWTGTPPPTSTPTNTFTNTYTFTVTNTRTHTLTHTETNTPTNTFTRTNTNTPTNTTPPTDTYTPTNTNSPTNTFTFTYTWTNTNTFTNTNTPTNTNSPTNTYTWTNTNSPTDTPTRTFTPTNTYTATETYTPTNTPTRTATPTITMTLPPFPYILKIGIYNSAGELVRLLVNTRASAIVNEIILKVDGNNSSLVTTDKKLEIKLPGVEVPDSELMTPDGVVFVWDVKNNAGQFARTGSYFIKFEEMDAYGHTNVVIKDIQVIKVEEYIEYKIFNSSGELVKTGREYGKPIATNFALEVKDIVYVEKTGGEIIIKYNKDNPTDYFVWDGKNDQGITVSSGNYEIQVTVVTADGKSITASKKVLLLRESDKIIDSLKIIPNPYFSKTGKGNIEIKWETENLGEAKIYIYNSAGDLVRYLYTQLQNKSIKWDFKTSTGVKVATGSYIIVFNAKTKEGHIENKIIKFSLILK